MDTFNEVKKKKEILYNNWSDHLNNTRERTNYSVRRMDLLVITICGAGLYVIFETFRELSNGRLVVEDISILKLSGVLFLISIISNFASQITGYTANNNEEKYTIQKLRKIEGKKVNEDKMNNLDNLSKNFTTATKILNVVSTTLMLIGLVSLAIFYYYHLF